MARIDAGAVSAESRWTHPSEIVAAAQEQIEQTLRRPRAAHLTSTAMYRFDSILA